MNIDFYPARAFVLALCVVLLFALSIGFFVGRACAPTSYRIDDEAARRLRKIEEEREKRHAAIDREHDEKRRRILERTKTATTQKLRKDLLEGAKP